VLVEYALHCLAPGRYYDRPGRMSDADSRFALSDRRPPSGWERAEHDLWVRVMPSDQRLPSQGWKLHLSSALDEAAANLELLWDYCTAHGLAFKFLRSGRAVHVVNSKSYPRGASAKVATVYPVDDSGLEKAAKDLQELFADRRGPHVLGDFRLGSAPVFVRYGGFTPRYCRGLNGDRVPAIEDNTGKLVPDVRGPVFAPPSWVAVPDFLQDVPATREFGYTFDKALHFSNAGGVYVATEGATGRQVVLKEARPMAGLDGDGRDAVERLRVEYTMLSDLKDLPFVPEVYGLVTWWEHAYLVMEHIAGKPLTLRPDTAWDVIERLRAMLDVLHDRGVVFGDLQPRNVIEGPTGALTLIDFEAATRPGDRSSGLATPGFAAPEHVSGPARDHYALSCLALHAHVPLTELLALDPSKRDVLIEAAEQPQEFAALVRRGMPDAPTAAPVAMTEQALARSILAAATPDRPDRLYPGDPAQFRDGAIGLAHGAAGVLHALHESGAELPAAHVDWLVRTSRGQHHRTGLYDGLHGVAWLLHRIGHAEARTVLDRAVSADPEPCQDLMSGAAGEVLNLLHFHHELGDASLLDQAVRRGAQLSAPARPGLLHGPSGVAVALLALHRSTADPAWLDAAAEMLSQDLRNGHYRRQSSDLATGTTGFRVAADLLLAQGDYADVRRARDLLAAPPRVLRQAGLFHGQAGLLAHHPTEENHRALSWHLVEEGNGTAAPGVFPSRLSADLATGTAGVLLAVRASTRPTEYLPLVRTRDPAVGSGEVAGDQRRERR
jgi:serine/threonine protein kinase